MLRFQIVIALGLLLAACSPKVETGGYIREGDLKGQIVEGQTTKDEILAKFGSPSAHSTFGNEAWYYITDRKETVAFLKPEVVERDVLRVEFGPTGIVSSVQAYNKDSGKDFEIVKRTTPTEGHSLGFVEQVVGNIGRFSKGGDSGAAPGRKPGSGAY